MSAKKWAILPSIISPRPQALKEEIRNENQDKRKIFDPGGIWTHDLLIRTPSLYQMSYEARLNHAVMSWFILSLQTRKRHDKSPTFKISTTSACILRGRNIFWTLRAERTTAGLMPLGLFLFDILQSADFDFSRREYSLGWMHFRIFSPQPN